MYSSPGLSQFMTPILPSGGNIIYKPQFIIPPLIERLMRPKADCEKDGSKHYIPVIPDMVVKKPLNPKEFTVIVPTKPEVIIENKPIVVPQPPVLPPFTMPEIPTFVEEPKTSAPVTEKHIQEKKENCKPLEIPAPPVLPKMPVFPIPENVDIFPDNYPIVPVISGIEPLPAPEFTAVEIPEAPMLPPLSLPELPVPNLTEVIPENKPAIIPEAPILSPIPNDHVSDSYLNEIPEGPTLPPFVIPPIPEIPIVEMNPEAPKPEAAPNNCIYDVPESVPNDNDIPELQPVEIPEPPVLPPFTMPELPAFPPIGKPEDITTVTENTHAENNPETNGNTPMPEEKEPMPEPVTENKPLEIPAPPILPPLEIPEFPVFETIPIEQTPPSPVLPPLEIPAPPPTIVEVPYVTPKETPPLILEVPEHPSVTGVISEPCDNNEIIPENKPILILEQTNPGQGVTTQQVVPEVMELNVGGAKVTIPSLGSLSFPNFCVQNLIIDRALPSMIIGEKYYAESLAPYVAEQHSMLPVFQYYKR
ncbi:protein PELPK1-like [Hyposmocoma kahamanoa]|uniref:protein PELPK1-like n=1 Tax=Hyposmocoma kahamanoa TaxID=1477025 RepID=UPI000E6D8184|nr:protein PELPK1-like [Hyposmocoma kahamanoa]